MAIYPAGKFRNIRPGQSDPPITVIGAILHVDAGNSGSLFSYFNGPSNGIESHFFVRKDGVVEQYRDTGYEADANLKANSFLSGGRRYGYISIETQGYGSGEWNAAQLAAIKALLLWLSKTHGFPLRRCPAHTQSGVGYHVMFGAPGPWTPVSKSCPGPDRVEQFNNILVPWFKTATPPAGGTPTAPVQEDDEMSAMTMDELEEYNGRLYGPKGTLGIWRVQDRAAAAAQLQATKEGAAAQVAAINELTAAVKALTEAVAAPKA